MRPAMARADDLPRRQIGRTPAQVIGHLGRCLAEQRQTAPGCVAAHAACQQVCQPVYQRTARRVAGTPRCSSTSTPLSARAVPSAIRHAVKQRQRERTKDCASTGLGAVKVVMDLRAVHRLGWMRWGNCGGGLLMPPSRAGKAQRTQAAGGPGGLARAAPRGCGSGSQGNLMRRCKIDVMARQPVLPLSRLRATPSRRCLDRCAQCGAARRAARRTMLCGQTTRACATRP